MSKQIGERSFCSLQKSQMQRTMNAVMIKVLLPNGTHQYQLILLPAVLRNGLVAFRMTLSQTFDEIPKNRQEFLKCVAFMNVKKSGGKGFTESVSVIFDFAEKYIKNIQ